MASSRIRDPQILTNNDLASFKNNQISHTSSFFNTRTSFLFVESNLGFVWEAPWNARTMRKAQP